MQNRSLKKSLANTIYLGLITTTTLLPLAPISSIAAEVNSNTAIVVLDNQSKTQVPEKAVEASATTAPVETTEISPQPEPLPKVESTGMSTGMKYTLGVGGAVIAIVGIVALAGGSSSDSSDSPPTPPTDAQMVGAWSAAANSVDGRTYTGTYTLYSGGSHTYDIYVSDGRHKVGSGAWKLVDYTLELRNFSGSTYRGTFAQGVTTSVTTVTTDSRWRTILTK